MTASGRLLPVKVVLSESTDRPLSEAAVIETYRTNVDGDLGNQHPGISILLTTGYL
jgi:hypothetical protein